jgi:DNA (cytosine-5)-methyltransferase 1
MNTEEYITITLKLGQHRGNLRLWVEGNRLAKAGFSVGARFTVLWCNDHLFICAQPDGDRKVSGRSRGGQALPIIDLNGPELAASLGSDCQAVTVYMATGNLGKGGNLLVRPVAKEGGL